MCECMSVCGFMCECVHEHEHSVYIYNSLLEQGELERGPFPQVGQPRPALPSLPYWLPP